MPTHHATPLPLLAALAACATTHATPAPRTAPVPTARSAHTAPPPPREPLPQGYALVRRPGFSMGVPAAWHRLGGVAYSSVVMGEGPDIAHGLFVSVATSPFEATLEDFLDLAAPAMASQHLAVVARTASRAGPDDAIDVESVQRLERTTRSRVLVAESRRVGALLVCGSVEPVPDDAAAACDAVLASLRFGGGPAPAAGLRSIAGDGWSVEVPDAWAERDPQGAVRIFGPPDDHIALALAVTSPPSPTPYTQTVLARFEGRAEMQVRDRRETVRGAGEHRTFFELTTHETRLTFNQVQRAFLHGDVAVVATCARAAALSADDRAECARVLDTLRGE